MPNLTAPKGSRYSGIFKNMVDGRIQIYDDGVLAATIANGTTTIAAGTITAMTASTTAALPQAVTIGGIAYTFPADNGDAGEQLQTDGSGGLTWEASGV